MRLIHCASLTLKLFNNEEELPEYAILSHRWVDDQEVLFKELLKPRNLHLSGWQKIHLCRSQALKDGIEYCWVDTCCIDKTSSAELSEAINSMYRYYSNAKICYAYLIDVDSSTQVSLEAQFIQSSWFTRCWTLQELIAPSAVLFYDKNWKSLGTRSHLCEEIAEASGIHLSVFTSRFEPQDWSIAQRMSWASKRTATRVEDVAYSLLGLFDVNIPLLYGEREKAFLRLQEEIIKRSSDHTIFAWSTFQNNPAPSSVLSCTGLLALSPYAFKDDSNLIAKKSDNTRAYAINNLGLEIWLPVVPWAPNVLLVGLDCTKNSQDRIYIFVMDNPGIAQIPVRTIYKGMPTIDLKWYLPSSTHRTLTMAVQLGSSMQTQLNAVKLDQQPYLIWSTGDMNTLPIAIRLDTEARRLASHWLSYRRPLYGFHCVLRVRPSRARREEARGTWKVKYVKFVKVGFDMALNPICIVSDRTYEEDQPPQGSLDVDLLYTKNDDITTKTFWECTGLEETGWTRPDTLPSTPTPKSERGVWALKGVHDSDCTFTLSGDQVGEQWMVKISRRRDMSMRPCFEVSFLWVWEFSPKIFTPGEFTSINAKKIRCANLNNGLKDICLGCMKGLEDKYQILPPCPLES